MALQCFSQLLWYNKFINVSKNLITYRWNSVIFMFPNIFWYNFPEKLKQLLDPSPRRLTLLFLTMQRITSFGLLSLFDVSLQMFCALSYFDSPSFSLPLFQSLWHLPGKRTYYTAVHSLSRPNVALRYFDFSTGIQYDSCHERQLSRVIWSSLVCSAVYVAVLLRFEVSPRVRNVALEVKSM